MLLVAGLTIAAFAVGVATAWVGARRRVRQQVAERMAREVEARLKEELLRRWSTQQTPDQANVSSVTSSGKDSPAGTN